MSVLSYDVGIGFDPVYPPRRHQQGIGEAAACDASMTIKGTEYNNGTRMTMLTDRAYHSQHVAIGDYNRWLEKHAGLYEGRTNAAQIGLLHPEEDLWRHWPELTPIYYGAGQALTHAGLPWRVVRRGDSLEGLTLLLTFSPEDQRYGSDTPDLNLLHIPDLPGWAWKKLSSAAKPGLWHNLVEKVGLSLLNAYHGSKFARHLMDKMNMVKLITQTTLFNLPSAEARETLLAALPDTLYPRVTADEPVLIETWKKGRETQIHLVNYANQPQKVTVQFAAPVKVECLSPDTEEKRTLEGQTVSLDLDIYTILLTK